MEAFLSDCYKKVKQNRKFLILIGFVVVVYAVISAFNYFYDLVFVYPVNQVSQYNITNVTEKANLINQYRVTSIQLVTTVAQTVGGIAILFSLYLAWENLITARDGQITERFTRAVNQLEAVDKDGNPAIEIRLGGIYALERISKESSKDYWSIMEILTAYVRKNSPNTDIKNKDAHGNLDPKKISFDIQAILTVIRRRNNSFNNGESNSLDLSSSSLRYANLKDINLAGATLQWNNLYGSDLQGAHFEDAILEDVIFEDTKLEGTNFQGAHLQEAQFKVASLIDTIFIGADLRGAKFEGADLQGAKFKGAILGGANLKGAKNITSDQLSEVETLSNAELDPELRESLKNESSYLFDQLTTKPE